MTPLLFPVIGAAFGAAGMFLFDPARGRRRRAALRDQTGHGLRKAGDALSAGTQDLAQRTRGTARSLASAFDGRDAPDEVLAERPRAKLGRRGERPAFLQDDWAPGTRLAGTAGATGLALLAFRSGGIPGLLLGGASALLLARSTSNQPLRRLAGLGGRRAIEVQKTITVDAPVARVFEYLSSFENFPRFMSNVKSVEPRAQGQTHWVVAGPAGREVRWNSVVTQYVPHDVIAWRSVEGSDVAHAGWMRFEPVDGATRVHIRMHYNPPAGALGHAIAKLFGADAKVKLDQDLMRLKSTIETGRVPHHAAARSPDAMLVR